jgi:phosphatidylserine/phosphatidylglycerophosphate/cardiolipin synthase-like enzyme
MSVIIAQIFAVILLFFQTQNPPFQLVESFPVETGHDMPDMPEASDVWIEMIRSAERSLDIEQFYISSLDGEALDPVLKEIKNAAKRGVIVRILLDARMSATYPEPATSLSVTPNIHLRTIDFSTHFGGSQHAKFFIADNRDAFMGSQNYDWRSLKHISEIGLRIRDQRVVDFYSAVFAMDWSLAGGKKEQQMFPATKIQSADPLMAMQSPGDTAWFTPTASPLSYIPDSSRWDEPHIMSTIARAQNELRLQFLSYTPYSRNGDYYPAIDSSIRAAARRGVQVKLMVADWGKGRRSEKYLKELSALPNIEVRYACVPEWSGGYISYARVEHCKIITADDQTFWLGTSNAEKNYFHASRNLGIVISNKKLTRQLNAKFDRSWESPASERITVQSSFLPREYGER